MRVWSLVSNIKKKKIEWDKDRKILHTLENWDVIGNSNSGVIRILARLKWVPEPLVVKKWRQMRKRVIARQRNNQVTDSFLCLMWGKTEHVFRLGERIQESQSILWYVGESG